MPDHNDLTRELEISFQRVVDALCTHSEECADDRHLKDTPGRLARALVEDYFSGLWSDPDKIFTRGVWEPVKQTDQMVMEKNIDFVSFCAHHFSPFVGHAHVAYVPDKKLIGLSKIPRVVEVFSRRPQVQERLTEQIADCLEKNLEPQGVGVVIEAEHFCMACRGVRKSGIFTRTTALRGCFVDGKTREEFLLGIR